MMALSACSQEAGPTPTGGGEDPGPPALATKLRAITQDVCYRSPGDVDPSECQKYITQLNSVPGQTHHYATFEAPQHPDAVESARALRTAIDSYNNGRCIDEQSDVEACTQSLQDIAEALEDVEGDVEDMAEQSG
ncbi:hypothetical protein BJF85_13445 [Saccharomonospora sp. CUA-673]|nr:hypothetical protein BJF85_13445 [Saccharomonospora sp. CUA-673]